MQTTHTTFKRRSHWRDLADYLAYRYGVGFGLVLLVVVLAAGMIWISAPVSRDLQGVPERQVEGRLTEVHYLPFEKRNTLVLSTFRVGDQEFTVNRWPEPSSVLPADVPRVGDAVRATYRVGKSGHRYLDRLERLEPVRHLTAPD